MLRSRFLSRFAREEKGNLAVESLILIPGLWLVFLVMVTIFDAYQQSNANQKASYAISDLVSRQTTPVDSDFLAGAKGLFDTLAYRANDTTVRITSVRWDAADNEFKLHWSQANGFKSGATASDVAQWHNLLPVVPDQEFWAGGVSGEVFRGKYNSENDEFDVDRYSYESNLPETDLFEPTYTNNNVIVNSKYVSSV